MLEEHSFPIIWSILKGVFHGYRVSSKKYYGILPWGGLCSYLPTWERPGVKCPSCSRCHSHIIPLWSVLIFSLSCSSETLPSYKLSSNNRISLKNPQAAGPCNAPWDKLQKRTRTGKKLKPTDVVELWKSMHPKFHVFALTGPTIWLVKMS